MLDRLSNVIGSSDNRVNINKMIDGIFDPLPIPLSTQLLAWLPKAPALPENTAEAPDLEAAMIAQVASISDQPPVPRNPTPTPATERPRDVYEDIPEPVTTEVTLADGTVQRTVIHKTRVYSDCALEHELSLCIRLESLWPWALQSFLAPIQSWAPAMQHSINNLLMNLPLRIVRIIIISERWVRLV